MLKPTNNLLYPIIAPILDALIPPLKPMPYFGLFIGVGPGAEAVLIVDGSVSIVDGGVYIKDGPNPIYIPDDNGDYIIDDNGNYVIL